MSTAACIVGGAAFGIVTSIATAAQEQDQAAPASPAPSDLGDDVVSFPLPTGSATPSPSMPKPEPTITVAAALVEPTPALTFTARPKDPGTPTPQPSTQQTRPAAPASPEPRSTHAASSLAPETKPDVVRETKPRYGWQPPDLQVGHNDITAPRLTSGADLATFVACRPSRACTVSGSVLFISPEATLVTVTWSAEPDHGYPHWRASTDLSR